MLTWAWSGPVRFEHISHKKPEKESHEFSIASFAIVISRREIIILGFEIVDELSQDRATQLLMKTRILDFCIINQIKFLSHC